MTQIKGYLKTKQVFDIKNRLSSTYWTKIIPKNAPITTLVLEKDTFYDDISILYDSENGNSEEQEKGLSQMLEKVIDEIMEKNFGEED